MSRKISRITLGSLLLASLVIVIGCFGTKFTLIDPAKAHVDRTYVGDWDAVNAKGEHADLVIRNIDDKLFYVETRSTDDAKAQTDRYVGFTADVNGKTFAHLRPLQENGDIPDTWLLMRLDLANENQMLTIRQLNEDFFKDKKIDTPDELRQVLTANIDNEAMYNKDEQITATRGGAQPAPTTQK